MPNAFNDLARVTRSYITAANVPTKMNVPNHGRPLGPNDSQPWKRKPTAQVIERTVNPTITYSFYPMHEEILEETNPHPENREISVHYASLDDVWCRNEMIIDDTLAYAVATEIMLSDDIEPRSIDESRPLTPSYVKYVGYKWVRIFMDILIWKSL
ncbi:hypothetical protein FF2_024503 [Malus domestica]